MKILMSKENPKGRKVEDLCQDMIDDLTEKNLILTVQMNKIGKDIDARFIIRSNNEFIIAMLKTSIEIQKRTMNFLEQNYGADRGPENPRI